jgi:DNA-binding transcriptional MerR regulator
MDDLVHLASEIIPKVAVRPDRHKVTAIPDARTVRYYIQQGIVDRPHGLAGPSALYGYKHMLQLVAVKILQSQYLPIRRIKEMLQGLDASALEERVQAWTAAGAPAIMGGGATIKALTISPPPAAPAPPEVPPPDPLPRTFGENRPAGTPGSAGPSWVPRLQMRARVRHEESSKPSGEPEHLVDSLMERSLRLEQASRQAEGGSGWSRLELHPGIELHVRHGIQLPQSPSFFSALASSLRVILQQMARPGTPKP